MKTFVILSDTHGRRRNVEKVLHILAENDCIVHLGDGSGDLREFSRTHPEKDVIVLKGNCDFSYGMEEYVIEAEGVRMLCCHGHKYGVKSGLARLAARAKEQGCTVALYGHTHRAAVEEEDGVQCINPGSLGSYADPSYCYLVVHKGKVTATVVPVNAS